MTNDRVDVHNENFCGPASENRMPMRTAAGRASNATGALKPLLAAILLTLSASMVEAADVPHRFDIPAQDLGSALKALGATANEQVLFSEDVVAGLRSRDLRGEYTADAAVAQLLEGTELKADRTPSGVLLIWRADARNAGPGTRPVADAADPRSLHLAQAETAVADEPKLDEVVVQGAKRKFAPTDSSAATKIPMDVINTPQSLSVLSSELMSIVGVNTINSAAALTPGAADAHGEPHAFFDFYVRGFHVNFYNGTKINGMPFVDEGGAFDFGIVDRFEVVRGPASIIYGQSDYGGTVNVQLKAPKAKSAFAGELGTDINGSSRAMVDVTGALTQDERLRGRLIVAYNNGKTPQDLAFNRATTVAPSFSFDVTERTKLDFNYFHSQRDVRFSQGFSLTQDPVTQEFSLPDVARNDFIGADFNRVTAATDFGVGKLSHDFGNNWTLTATSSLFNIDFVRNVTIPFSLPVPDSGITNLAQGKTNRQVHDASSDLTLTGDFKALGKTHTIMLSGFYRSLKQNLFNGCCTTIGTIDYFNPINRYTPVYADFPTDPEDSPRTSSVTFSEHSSTKDLAFSSLLLLHPIDRLSVMLGLRYNKFEGIATDFYDRSISHQIPDPYKDHAITHRMGVVYELIDNVNIYGSFSDGVIFQPAITASGSPLEPETGIQWEFGAKSALLNKKLTVSAAIFKIDRENVAAPDPAHPAEPFSIAINGQTHKGFELEAIGEPIPGWNIISSYSYLDVSITNAPDPAMIGQQRAGSPHHMGKLYTTYQLLNGPLRGVSFGGGMFYNSTREADDVGTFKLPAYTRFDLRLGYDALENVSFSLNAINISNEKIVSTAGFGIFGGLDYQSRRTVLFGVNFKY